MLQIVIWALCTIILGMGFVLKFLNILATPLEKRGKNTGSVYLIMFFLLAAALFILSILQVQELPKLF